MALQLITAGESHGPGLTCILEGLPAGLRLSREDVDTALILGAGFPFWLGGITKYLDQAGIAVNTPAS